MAKTNLNICLQCSGRVQSLTSTEQSQYFAVLHTSVYDLKSAQSINFGTHKI